MIDEFKDLIQEILENPTNWHYEIDKMLQYYELLLPQDWSKIETCFITSTGRTGTKFLAEFFNEFDDFLSIHEPQPNFRKLSREYAEGKCGLDKAIHEIEIKRSALCRRVKRERSKKYLESNPRLFSLLKPIKKVFEEPKIIHIVRDGRDFVRSGMSRPYGAFYSNKDIHPRLKAVDFTDDDFYHQWDDMSLFEKICWYWMKRDEFIYQEIKDYSNGITVRFEDIFKRPDDYIGLKEICDFLKLNDENAIPIFQNMQKNKINKTKVYAIPHWKDWSEEKKLKFDQIAGKHMQKYYDYW